MSNRFIWPIGMRCYHSGFRTLVERDLPLYRDAVGLFCSPSWLGQKIIPEGVCIYEGDSTKTVNFAGGMAGSKHYLLLHLYQGNQ